MHQPGDGFHLAPGQVGGRLVCTTASQETTAVELEPPGQFPFLDPLCSVQAAGQQHTGGQTNLQRLVMLQGPPGSAVPFEACSHFMLVPGGLRGSSQQTGLQPCGLLQAMHKHTAGLPNLGSPSYIIDQE